MMTSADSRRTRDVMRQIQRLRETRGRRRAVSPETTGTGLSAPLIMRGDQYVPGSPVDWPSKKTICFLTRCHPARPNMQRVCFDSVKNQTCDDYQHFLLRGAMRESDEFSKGDGKFAIEHGLTKPWPIDAHYVMVLDDDNMLAYPDFVREFRELVQKENPDIVFFRAEIKGQGIYPWWNHTPTPGHIDWMCYAVRRELWEKHIKTIEAFRPPARAECNDSRLAAWCYQDTKAVIWFNRLVATTQRGPGRCRPETEF